MIAPLTFANPSLYGAYQNDPRQAYAQNLMQIGSSPAPVRSPLEGFARALTAGLGGYSQNRLQQSYQARDQQYRDAMSAALQSPDIGQALMSSQDPTLQNEGMRYALELGQTRAKAKLDLQNQYAAHGMILHDDGTVTQVPKFGQVQGEIAGESTQAQIPAEVAKQNAMIPGEVQKATSVGQAMIPVNAADAAARAAATEPIEVRKAAETAAATMPYDIAKQISVYNQTQGPQQNYNNVEKLRDDYRNDLNVKNYQTVQPIMESMKTAAKTNTRAADLDMIYAFAKIMDPNSVVREGEQILVKDTGALGDLIRNYISKVDGGQGLTAETRYSLVNEAQTRVDNLKSVYDAANGYYTRQAAGLGRSPDQVFYDMPTGSPAMKPGEASSSVAPNYIAPVSKYGAGKVINVGPNGEDQ